MFSAFILEFTYSQLISPVFHLYVIFLIAGSWNDVFKVSVALYIIGTLVWNIFSTGEKILD
jgi:hypothetical protein